MLLNHTSDFANFTAATTGAKPLVPPLLEPVEPIAAMDAGTRIETAKGWRSAGQLCAGDLVHTLDGGLVPVLTARSRQMPRYACDLWFIPQGALNNCDAVRITAAQSLLISHSMCDALFGTPDVLVPARAMVGFRGITSGAGLAATHLVELAFEQEEVIFAQSGTLLHCPAASGKSDGFFRTLTYGEARALLTLMSGNHYAPDLAA